MRYPNFKEEKKLWKKGVERVVGLDEVGRGALAGPVVACSLCLKIRLGRTSTDFKKIRDSKKLPPKKREYFYKILTKNPDIEWGIGRVSERMIDKINILEATKLAMGKAINNLKSRVDFLILDGNFRIRTKIPQKSIIKADEKVFSCAAASIIAKVNRDKLMMRYHKKYPQYGFDKHKGYPTRLHRLMIKKHGFCKIHRKSFRWG